MAKTKVKIPSYIPKSIASQVSYFEELDLCIAVLDPKSLSENPKNWRVHTRRQRDVYKAFKEKHGWLQCAIYNLRTERLLDGHMRIDEAIKNKEDFVPVILKDVSEEDENEILANLDNIGMLAKRNQSALDSLLEANKSALGTVKNKREKQLAQLTEDLQQFELSVVLPQANKKLRVKKDEQEEEEEGEDAEENYTPPEYQSNIVEEYINADILFEGSTDLDIPQLDSGRITEPSDAPIRTFLRDEYGREALFCISSGPFEQDAPIGTLSFYTEDHRFEDAYTNPSVFADYLEALNPQSIVSPDFSTYADWPMVIRLHNLYRSRWCTRFFQELGFNVIPSVTGLGSEEFEDSYVFETLGNPATIALQCRKSEVDGLINFINRAVEICKPECVVLYGGEEKQKYLHGYLTPKIGRKKVQYNYLPNFIEKSRKLRKKKNANARR